MGLPAFCKKSLTRGSRGPTTAPKCRFITPLSSQKRTSRAQRHLAACVRADGESPWSHMQCRLASAACHCKTFTASVVLRALLHCLSKAQSSQKRRLWNCSAVTEPSALCSAASWSPPTVSDTKAAFYENFKKPIPPIYNTVIQELLVQQHLMRWNKNYQFDEVSCLLARGHLLHERCDCAYQPAVGGQALLPRRCLRLGRSRRGNSSQAAAQSRQHCSCRQRHRHWACPLLLFAAAGPEHPHTATQRFDIT